MSDIDRVLREAGASWRKGQPPPPELAPLAELATQGRRRRWLFVPIGATGIALVLTITAMLVGRPADNAAVAAWSTDDIAAQIVRVGDRVRARGMVRIAPGEQPVICRPYTDLETSSAPECSPISVPLLGLDASSLPEPMERGGVVFDEIVAITGVWTGDAISVETVASDLGRVDLTVVPCPAPPTGWVLPSGEPADIESQIRRLADELSEHPADYAGYWPAFPSPNDAAVMVVSVLGGAEERRQTLTAVYPWAICLVEARFAVQDLESLAVALDPPGPGWPPHVDLRLNRVLVPVILVDQAVVDRLAEYPQALPEALMTRL